jgi:hypothetical protein
MSRRHDYSGGLGPHVEWTPTRVAVQLVVHLFIIGVLYLLAWAPVAFLIIVFAYVFFWSDKWEKRENRKT